MSYKSCSILIANSAYDWVEEAQLWNWTLQYNCCGYTSCSFEAVYVHDAVQSACSAREVEALHGTLIGHLEITNTLEFDKSLPLSTILQGSDVEESAKQRKRTVGLFSGRSLVTGPPGVSGDGLQVSSTHGRKVLSIDEYIKRVAQEDAPFVVSPADEVNMAAGKNRKSRSLERTMLFANQMANKEYRGILGNKFFLFKVVVPSSKPGALKMQLSLSIAMNATYIMVYVPGA